jgi:polysaccharide export outer membrane protein
MSNKKLIYIQNQNENELKATPYQNPKVEYVIQTNDVLSILIKSPQPEFNEIFNLNSIANNNTSNSIGGLYLSGYTVSDSGYVALPTVGKVFLRGNTISQARVIVEREVAKFVNNATVQIKLLSFKISVLGEVKNAGYFYVYNNQATIFEGLGLAGDITEFGNRSKVKLIRQTASGSEVAILDITKPNILSSKYYYLLPNDVLYVQPLKAKTARNNLQPLGVLFGGITAIAVILRFVYDVNN